MDRIRISSRLMRIAKKLIAESIIDSFRAKMIKSNPNVSEIKLRKMCYFINTCSTDANIQKLASHCLVKGFIKWPDGQKDFENIIKLSKSFRNIDCDMIRNKTDYDKLVHPEKYPKDPYCRKYVNALYGEEGYKEPVKFNPATDFKGKKYTDGVVTIYTLKDTPEEMINVRKAIDNAYEGKVVPWYLDVGEHGDFSFEKGSDNFINAWNNWNLHKRSPKRLALVGRKPVALYMDNHWFDIHNKKYNYLPVDNAKDDPDFLESRMRINEFCKNFKGTLTEDDMLELLDSPDSGVRRAIAELKELPKNVFIKSILNDDPGVRISISERKDLPVKIVRYMVNNDKSIKVRETLAGRDKLPSDLIRTLAEDNSQLVRRAIAERNDLPDDLIDSLVSDDSDIVRIEIAKRKKLSEKIIRELSDDKSLDVQISISERNDLPDDLAKTMKKRKNKFENYEKKKAEELQNDLTPDLSSIRMNVNSYDSMTDAWRL